MQNNCYRLTDIQKLSRDTVDIPSISQDEVLVQISYCGICGSDIHFYKTNKQGDFTAQVPLIPGHEACGVVQSVGAGVKHIKIGDRVAIEPGDVCGECHYCKTGRYNLCKEMKFPSTPPYDGYFANYVRAKAQNLYLIPDSVSLKDAALIEPLACALNATRQGDVGFGKSVAIIGAGCIGLLVLVSSLARGADEVYISDTINSRLDFAKAKGATMCVNVKTANFCDSVLTATASQGADVVIECSGTKAGIASTVDLVKPGGTVVFMGLPAEDEVPYNVSRLIWKEAQIKTSFRYRNCYADALNAIKSGKIDLSGFITDEFLFENLPEAFEYVCANAERVIKTVIKM